MGLRLLEQNFRAAQIPGYAVGLRDHDASVHNIWVAYYAQSQRGRTKLTC